MGRAGQHGVRGLAWWGAVEVLTSWTCCRRVESKRAAVGEDFCQAQMKLSWNPCVELWRGKMSSRWVRSGQQGLPA